MAELQNLFAAARRWGYGQVELEHVSFGSVLGPDRKPLKTREGSGVGLMYLLLRTGYVVAQACVGGYVVFLLGMGGTQLGQTVRDRVLLTLVGGVLAMIAYANTGQ